ncbi:hypothetical protein XENOCAPTIV_029932 [Xenoophorus captivus]|uniref:Secreted protein n=1 Tax=Xenoophorus captivus TaxID=1517983 RepID=A0ABV0QFA3_9TELE
MAPLTTFVYHLVLFVTQITADADHAGIWTRRVGHEDGHIPLWVPRNIFPSVSTCCSLFKAVFLELCAIFSHNCFLNFWSSGFHQGRLPLWLPSSCHSLSNNRGLASDWSEEAAASLCCSGCCVGGLS